MARINVATVRLLAVPGTVGNTPIYEELRGYNDCKMSDGFVTFTWFADTFFVNIKERVTYPMWRVLEVAEVSEEEEE